MLALRNRDVLFERQLKPWNRSLASSQHFPGDAGCQLEVMLKRACRSRLPFVRPLEAISEWAWEMGLVFQLADDVVDLVADEAWLRKPVGSDIGYVDRVLDEATDRMRASEKAAARIPETDLTPIIRKPRSVSPQTTRDRPLAASARKNSPF